MRTRWRSTTTNGSAPPDYRAIAEKLNAVTDVVWTECSLKEMEDADAAIEAAVAALRHAAHLASQLAECYRLSGADPDYRALIERIEGWSNITPDNRADLLAALRGAAQEREALERLVAKLDAIDAHPGLKAVFTIAMVHGVAYNGPNWSDELKAARAALAPGGQ